MERTDEYMEELEECLDYAIDRLTDEDLAGIPSDLRHAWALWASNLITRPGKPAICECEQCTCLEFRRRYKRCR